VRRAGSVLALALTLHGAGGYGRAAVFTVNSPADVVDPNPGDGLCETATSNGVCTLRAAVMETNALPGPDAIYLPSAASPSVLGIPGQNEDKSVTGDLDIKDELELTGDGPELSMIDGGGVDRVLDVWVSNVVISGVAILNGAAGSNWGGGVRNLSSGLFLRAVAIDGNSAATGGGIHNPPGTFLLVTESTIADNTATQEGGGVFNDGSLALVNATVSGNSGQLAGGGLENRGELSLGNVTVSGNVAPQGAGILSFTDTAVATIANATITANSGTTGAGIEIGWSGTATIRNTILANTAGPSCVTFNGGSITSAGHNLDSGTSCGFTATGDLVDTNPNLGTLRDNGGPTVTHALLPGSLAIDGGDPAGCADADGLLTTDQRGVKRPQGAHCDIGAYEFQVDPCANATTIPAGGGTFQGTTSDVGALAGTCAATASSPERAFVWTPSASGTATIATCGAATEFDTVLYVRTGSCASGAQLACSDDGCGDPALDPGSRLTPTVAAGTTYFIVVDGKNGAQGDFSLSVTAPTTSTTTSSTTSSTSSTTTTSTTTTSPTSTSSTATTTTTPSTVASTTSTVPVTTTASSSTSTSTSSTTSSPTTTLPRCGNEVVDPAACDPTAPGQDVNCCITCNYIPTGQPCRVSRELGLCHERSTCSGSGQCVHQAMQAGTVCRNPDTLGSCDGGDVCDGQSLGCPLAGAEAGCTIAVDEKSHQVKCTAEKIGDVRQQETACEAEGKHEGSGPNAMGAVTLNGGGETVVDPISKHLRRARRASRRTLKLKLNTRGKNLLKGSPSGTLVVRVYVTLRNGPRGVRQAQQLFTFLRKRAPR
jgi:CSLREA domain-containing protein